MTRKVLLAAGLAATSALVALSAQAANIHKHFDPDSDYVFDSVTALYYVKTIDDGEIPASSFEGMFVNTSPMEYITFQEFQENAQYALTIDGELLSFSELDLPMEAPFSRTSETLEFAIRAQEPFELDLPKVKKKPHWQELNDKHTSVKNRKRFGNNKPTKFNPKG